MGTPSNQAWRESAPYAGAMRRMKEMAIDLVRDALIRSIGSLPEQLRRSVTWDQGKEMREHA